MKTSIISSIMSEKIDIMHCWKDGGELQSPKDIIDRHRFRMGK
jgi:hypothetical protein